MARTDGANQSKKGLSLDEKKGRIMGIFHESKEFFQLKDLEAEGKKRGVTGMGAVKELVEEMVADNQINKEKIGTSNYFWSYPAEQREAQMKRIEKHEHDNTVLRCKVKELTTTIETAENARTKSKDRDKLLKLYSASQAKVDELEKELAKMSALDPDRLGRLERLVADLQELALHWNEIVSSGLKYLEENGAETAGLKEELKIPDDFEDLAFD